MNTLKILCFSRGKQFIAKFTMDKVSLWPSYKKRLFIGWEGIICDQAGNISKLIHWGSHQDPSYRGTWTGHCEHIQLFFYITKLCTKFSVLGTIAIWCNKHCHSSSVLIVNTDPEIKAHLENSIQGRHQWIGNLKLVKLIGYSKILTN